MMNDDNPTKDLTGSEKLDRILSRFDRIEGRLGGVENRLGSIEEDRAKETLKLDAMLAAIQELQRDLKEVKVELRRLNVLFEKVAGEQHRQ
jgi:DNA-binding FrmR family transcriptional regulator